MSISLLGTVDNYDSFEYLVDTREIDVFHLLTSERREQLYNYEDSDILSYGRAELLTKMAIRYVSKHTPNRIATSITADLYASKGEVSPPLYNPHWPSNCRQLFHLGFWPHGITIDEYSVLLYLTYTNKEIHRKIGLPVPSGNVEEIEACLEWVYTPVGMLHSKGARNGKGLQLSLQAPDLVYASGRPKTDMAIFRNANSNRISISSISDWKCVIRGEEWSVIPITRYTDGMSRSLFYREEPCDTKYCGTFYYYEPESTTLLAYKKVLRAFNKTVAMKTLLKEAGTEYDYDVFHNDNVEAHIAGKIPRDLVVEKNGITFYGGSHTYDLYAAEDELDQPLCKLAAELGYDIVILESMVGSFQVVTEVLDVRSRHDSFLSLVYTY